MAGLVTQFCHLSMEHGRLMTSLRLVSKSKQQKLSNQAGCNAVVYMILQLVGWGRFSIQNHLELYNENPSQKQSKANQLFK